MVCTPSILDPKRNPGITQGRGRGGATGFLGVEKVVWLPNGLVDDETGGHVDNVACFARPGVVLALSADDKADANYTRLTENLDVLRAATDARGRTLEVLPVPQPKARTRHDGRRLSLSYINFYVANGGVVMPAFQDAADQAAFKAVSAAFPGRQVVQVEVLDILEGGGGIHCITQQEPDPAAPPAQA